MGNILQIDSAELAISRVKQRVRKGGHNVAEPVIRRRFVSGLQNFHAIFKNLVDEWSLYEKSEEQSVLIDAGVNI